MEIVCGDLLRYERAAQEDGFTVIAGIDEAGRGPLAGPVVACACLFSEAVLIEGIDDSKSIAPAKRRRIFEELRAHEKSCFGIGVIDHATIDIINIYQATVQAMFKAVEALPCIPQCLLVDGLALPYPLVHCEKIIKGDTKSLTIAAASIVAKETRDDIMRRYHVQWPQYGFDKHKGYGTAAHLEALGRFGPCPIHRRSFAPVRNLC